MKLFKNFFLILTFFSLYINFLIADDNVSYIDIDYILTNSLAGKKLLTILKKEEELKINNFKLNDDNFKNEEKKILSKNNLIELIDNQIKDIDIK